MDAVLRLLFSVYGRIGRKRYWLGKLAIVGICVVVFVLGELMAGSTGGAEGAYQALMTMGIVFLVISIPIWIAIGTKRLHDRNKRGWWLLLYYLAPLVMYWNASARQDPIVPLMVLAVALLLWGQIELGFLPGTRGTNRFGEDPVSAG